MLGRILNADAEELLAEERALLTALASALARAEAAPEDQKTLERSAAQLDELFLLVVAGEFNAGKSAFINALLGRALLEEGVTPTTTRIQVLRYGDAERRTPAAAALDQVSAPIELLREIHIVDTPGTNAILREHESITRDFVPRSDLVLFVTSADRPFTESERDFLRAICDWGKKIIVVVNKIDILESPEEAEQIRSFIAGHAATLLGLTPEIFLVSARQALRGKTSGDRALVAASRFGELERFIDSTLDERERLRLKLANPLGVAGRLVRRYRETANGRIELLRGDFNALDDVERQLALYREDMAREFRLRLSDVASVLQELESRGLAFCDETLRLARVFDLVNKARVKAAFQERVVADAPRQIERRVHELIDWLVASELRQWEAVMERLEERRRHHEERIVGRIGGTFELDRARLLGSVGAAAEQAIEGYDRDAEATRLAESVQNAVASTALVEVGALGLGALVAHVLAGAAADATGVLAASVVAALGLFIIPGRRQAAKRELRQKIGALREKLMASLASQFEREMAASLRRIEEAVAPYTRFVRAERGRLEASRDELQAAEERLAALARRVESL